ncbi:MAG: methyltransferase domain-containing protein [Chlorobiaceae bacterium]|nr:methyltransferase domain-containing protein [Chlorobiaceae bacterium]
MAHEFDGKKYEQASAHQKEWGAKVIAELDLRGTESVLDLGCGDGALTLQIAGQLSQGRVLGIDASKGMIEAAMPNETVNLEFMVMDIDDLDFGEEFDVVFSNATLHWVKDHRRLLGNVRRALRPGGRVRFDFAGEGNCMNFFSVVREIMALDRFADVFAGYEWPWYMPSVEAYTELAEESGLRNVRVWGGNADRFFPERDAMIRWIDQPSIVPLLAVLPESLRVPFRDEVVERMVERTLQPDGTCFETFRRINLAAEK